jgi:hypothetical protein
MWLLVDSTLLLSLTVVWELFLYLRRREHSRDAARMRRIARLLVRDARISYPALAGVVRRQGKPAEAHRN